MYKKTLALVLILLTPTAVLADEQNISIFKNGTSFTVRKIKQLKKDNFLVINNVPDALFGSIFFNPKDNFIRSLISENILVSENTKTENLADLINANMGNKASVTLNSNENYEIKIIKSQSDLLIGRDLKSLNENTLVFNLGNIKVINFSGTQKYEFEKKVSKKAIKIEFKDAKANQELQMIYMQKGLTWLPSYQIDLKDDNTAKISLNANIINDAEDIEKADLSLVIGYPNFSYSYLKSPFTSMQEINEFFNQLEYPSTNSSSFGFDQRRVSNMSNIMNQSASAESYSSNTSSFQDSDNISQNEDLYFYKIPQKVSLKKSSRAIFELFSEQISYQNIYEVDLDSNQNNYSYYQSKTNKVKDSEEILPKVWHSLRILNSTKFPFTTGTAMVTKYDKNILRPISQDKLNYTSIGSKTKLKLTLSPDIFVKETEKEISRKENINSQDGHYFDLVTIESEIYLKNNNKKPINLNINRVIEGELLTSNQKWAVNYLNIYKVQNKTNKIEWEIDLKPDETKKIKYKYSIYIRR